MNKEHKTVDLRKVTRDAEKVLTQIEFSSRHIQPLTILAGRASVDFSGQYTYGTLSARARASVTDMEHDSAYVFQIPITSFHVVFIDNGTMYATALVLGRTPSELRLSLDSKYDPEKVEGVRPCGHCRGKNKHIIVPSSHWQGPPEDVKLYQQLIGAKLEIRIIPL